MKVSVSTESKEKKMNCYWCFKECKQAYATKLGDYPFCDVHKEMATRLAVMILGVTRKHDR